MWLIMELPILNERFPTRNAGENESGHAEYVYIEKNMDWPPLGQDQLIVWFMSATHPNLELENSIFLRQKNEVLTTADMWLWGQIDFFHATLHNCSFSL